MSMPEREAIGGRDPASYTVAGYLTAFSLFVGLFALVYYSGRIGPGAMLIALIAAAMGGPHRRLAAFALTVTTLSWFVGMIVAVLLERPIF